jgi:periplasmic divalent cation tolerance protein
MNNKQIVVIKTYCGTEAETIKMAKELVNNRLAACCNYSPCNSIFRWKNELEVAQEWILSIKTIEANCQAIVKSIQKEHSYDLPAIIIEKKDVNSEYFTWVFESCS